VACPACRGARAWLPRVVLGLTTAVALAVSLGAGRPTVPRSAAPARPPDATDTASAAASEVTVAPATTIVLPPLLPPPVWDGTWAPPVRSAAAAVVDGRSGALLFGQEPDRRLPPASLTKIVTAMVALDRGDLDASVTVDVDGARLQIETDSSVMGLRPGETLMLRDLLYGLMLPSGNDAAIAVARHIAGDEAAFVALMNEKVARLGLTNTHFRNPHGLDAPDHYTTARDIAQLSLWAMYDERFRAIVAAREWTVRGSRTYTLVNGNPLLSVYAGADGIKTGWTDEAGRTLVGSATRAGRRLFVVLLDTPDQTAEATALLDWAFAHFLWLEEP
jgi:D-alanyl-D-alanine carboxypeptidase (penicillin-binding protein 5/6)